MLKKVIFQLKPVFNEVGGELNARVYHGSQTFEPLFNLLFLLRLLLGYF